MLVGMGEKPSSASKHSLHYLLSCLAARMPKLLPQIIADAIDTRDELAVCFEYFSCFFLWCGLGKFKHITSQLFVISGHKKRAETVIAKTFSELLYVIRLLEIYGLEKIEKSELFAKRKVCNIRAEIFFNDRSDRFREHVLIIVEFLCFVLFLIAGQRKVFCSEFMIG